MKKKVLLLTAGVFSLLSSYSQSSNDVLNLLTQKKVINQQEADSLRADAAIKQQQSYDKFNPLPLITSKGIVLSGFTQVRIQDFQQSGNYSGFDLRRARLDFNANVSKWWGFRVQYDFAATPRLLDAYVDLKINDYFNVSFGQFKTPYDLEGLTPTRQFEFIDNSQVVSALTARGGTGIPTDVIGNQQGYDDGIQISGKFIKLEDRSLIEYKAAVVNGSGLNTLENNHFKDVVGRLVFHPFKGIDFGGFVYNGTGFYNNAVVIPPAKTAIADDHVRNRYGAEINIEYSGASLRAEYIKGKDGSILRDGYYVSAGYFVFPKRLQLLYKVDTYNPNISSTKLVTTNYTTALNYYFYKNTRLQLAYTFRNEKIYVKNNLAVVQFQIGF